MNTYAKKGEKITVTEKTIKSGHISDQRKASEFLKVGKWYTVERTDVGKWSTVVFIQEVPGVGFNSVHFVQESEFNVTP
jgi:hypothetical protein